MKSALRIIGLFGLLASFLSSMGMQIPPSQPDLHAMLARHAQLSKQNGRKAWLVNTIGNGLLIWACCAPGLSIASKAINYIDSQWLAGALDKLISYSGNQTADALRFGLLCGGITGVTLLYGITITPRLNKFLRHNVTNKLPSVIQARREKRVLEDEIINRASHLKIKEITQIFGSYALKHGSSRLCERALGIVRQQFNAQNQLHNPKTLQKKA